MNTGQEIGGIGSEGKVMAKTCEYKYCYYSRSAQQSISGILQNIIYIIYTFQ